MASDGAARDERIIGVAGILVGYYLAIRRKVKISGAASERRQAREKNF